MRYAGLIPDDIQNGEGICVSLFVQGCHRHCKGCFNKEAWDFKGGEYCINLRMMDKILKLLQKNGVKRNLSILGGEPLDKENRDFVFALMKEVKEKLPQTKIFLWTGYTIEELKEYEEIKLIDVLIDGPFIEEQKDVTLKWRGSRNQRIIYNPMKENQIIEN